MPGCLGSSCTPRLIYKMKSDHFINLSLTSKSLCLISQEHDKNNY